MSKLGFFGIASIAAIVAIGVFSAGSLVADVPPAEMVGHSAIHMTRAHDGNLRLAACTGTAPSSCTYCHCDNYTVCGPNSTNCHQEEICNWQERQECQ
jgi:hypothetical protein